MAPASSPCMLTGAPSEVVPDAIEAVTEGTMDLFQDSLLGMLVGGQFKTVSDASATARRDAGAWLVKPAKVPRSPSKRVGWSNASTSTKKPSPPPLKQRSPSPEDISVGDLLEGYDSADEHKPVALVPGGALLNKPARAMSPSAAQPEGGPIGSVTATSQTVSAIRLAAGMIQYTVVRHVWFGYFCI